MKTFIVLFSVNAFTNPRKLAEQIENNTFKLKAETDAFTSAYKIREVICKELKIPKTKKECVEVYPLTDFMDSYNNEEINEVGTFMTYVNIN